MSVQSGNIILTDADLKILTLARTVSEGEGQEPQRVGLEYSLVNRQNFAGIPPLTKERVHDALKAAVAKAAVAAASSKKIKGKPGGDLRKALAVSITELPPILVDHALQKNQFDTSTKPEEVLASETLLEELVRSLSEARKTVENITSSATCPGYIFAKRQAPKPESTEEGDSQNKREGLLYEDFHPFIPHKLEKDPTVEVLEFKSYNETVDEFFSSIEGQKLEARLTEREVAAKRKLDAAKQEQSKRIEGLQEAQTLNFRKAAAIEANVERVQEAMDAVNGLLGQGMDWVDIGKLVEREKKRNNPVADIIKLPLNLSDNLVTLELAEEEVVEEEEEDPYETDNSASDSGDESTAAKGKPSGKELAVEINLTLTPWSNAREYYDQRKTAVDKQEKTQQQVAKALKSTEQKINHDLKKGLKQEKALLQPIRKQLWFEKFIWFISSDGYLVIGGKDAQQNEIIYKRYLRKGDVYCHADLHGASSIIIKNNPKTPDAPIPPATLSQAGSLAVCSSDAWDSKAGMSAWWVNADQVSKSAPTGEFLPTGSFMVRDEKNFLPPAQLLLGLGVMFKISEESMARHVKHRLYDGDFTAGNEAARPTPSKDLDEHQSAETEQPDVTEHDEASDDESDDEQQRDEKPRDNPLQAFGSGDRDADVQEAEEGISELNVDDKPASEETPAQEEDEQSDEEESEDHEPAESVAEASEAPSKSSAQTSGTGTPTPGKKAAAKRGQRGKAKKIAAKYRNQDDDDRAAAEALIGAAAGREKAEAEAKAKLDREAELAAAKERRRAQHQRQQKETAEHEEIRRVMMDEGLDVLDVDEADQMTALDALVGTPLPGDEILEIIPVCAPWNALGRFKYKAKLQPGATKKGKAVKEILERWKAATTKKGVVDETARDSERMWPREVELLKALKPEETYNCVPVGKVRVMMSGGTSGGGGGGKKGQGKGGRGGKGSKRS